MPGRNTRKVCIEILDIVNPGPRSIPAVVKRTGKVAYFPRRFSEVYPGRIYVPLWWARKAFGCCEAHRKEEEAIA